MFDWNDEELTNVIWGVAGQRDDNIVPYPGQIEGKHTALFEDHYNNEANRQSSDIDSVQQKKSTLKSALMDELEQESLCTDASQYLTKGSKNSSLREETRKLDNDSEILERPTEDGEEKAFVDYGWANIGSFDDLDRIFSDNDQIFGDLAVGYTDELWPSSKDIAGIPLELTSLAGDSSDVALRSLWDSTEKCEIEDHNLLDSSHSSISGYAKQNEINYQDPHDVQTFVTEGRYEGSHKLLNTGTAANHSQNKENLFFSCFQDSRQKKLSKHQKLDRKNEASLQHNSRILWNSSNIPLQQVGSQFTASEVNPSSSSALTQQRSSQSKHFSGIPLAAPCYGNIMSHEPAPPVLLPPVYEAPTTNVNSSKNPQDSSAKPPRMTPKEKIEKLRRRQQMRAILAIHKQELQFNNQVPVSESSSIDKGTITAEQNTSSFPTLDPSSPTEQNDSRTVSMVFNNCSVEESVLYRLQNTISKMDTRIRVSIRDSLFRLAQSAIQRQYPSDTISNSTNSRDETRSNSDTVGSQRFTRVRDVETETNPIDRTVARLLFHRPRELSGKLAEPSESPSLKSISKRYFLNDSESTHPSKFLDRSHSKPLPTL